ncbi:MAG: hypothetical protein M5T61_13360 [Acidimicrobiia bacterium]|nr:hypothetical protein [Acidimicrobiia bacterium]
MEVLDRHGRRQVQCPAGHLDGRGGAHQLGRCECWSTVLSPQGRVALLEARHQRRRGAVHAEHDDRVPTSTVTANPLGDAHHRIDTRDVADPTGELGRETALQRGSDNTEL